MAVNPGLIISSAAASAAPGPSASPAAGRVVAVPDAKGPTEAAARKEVMDAGLVPRVVFVEGGAVDQVIGQKPTTGEFAARGSVVTIYVGAERTLTAASTASALTELTTKVDAVTNDVGSIKTDVDKVKTDVGTVKTDVGTVQATVAATKIDVGTVQKDVGTLQKSVGSLTTDVGMVKTDLKAISPSVKSIVTAVEKIDRDVTDIKKKL